MNNLKGRIKFMRPRDWAYSILSVLLVIAVFASIVYGVILQYGIAGGALFFAAMLGPPIILGSVLGVVYLGYRGVRRIIDNRPTHIRRPK